ESVRTAFTVIPVIAKSNEDLTTSADNSVSTCITPISSKLITTIAPVEDLGDLNASSPNETISVVAHKSAPKPVVQEESLEFQMKLAKQRFVVIPQELSLVDKEIKTGNLMFSLSNLLFEEIIAEFNESKANWKETRPATKAEQSIGNIFGLTTISTLKNKLTTEILITIYSIEEKEMATAAQNFKLVTYFGIIGHSLNLDIVLGFIPKPDNSKRAAGTFGLSKEEKTSNMVHNWPAWARGIFTLNGSKIELSKYTYSSIEKGLYVAAYRICWFLTEGLKNILPPLLLTLAHQVSNMKEAKYSFIASQYNSFSIIQMKMRTNQTPHQSEVEFLNGSENPSRVIRDQTFSARFAEKLIEQLKKIDKSMDCN
ncbi:hypothetical protein BLOT_009105, partial [Blomia tropicalis]